MTCDFQTSKLFKKLFGSKYTRTAGGWDFFWRFVESYISKMGQPGSLGKARIKFLREQYNLKCMKIFRQLEQHYNHRKRKMCFARFAHHLIVKVILNVKTDCYHSNKDGHFEFTKWRLVDKRLIVTKMEKDRLIQRQKLQRSKIRTPIETRIVTDQQKLQLK